MLNANALSKLVQVKMPFGKYQGTLLMDVPEHYLLWLNKQGMPKGELGELLTLALEIRINGLEALLEPLRQGS